MVTNYKIRDSVQSSGNQRVNKYDGRRAKSETADGGPTADPKGEVRGTVVLKGKESAVRTEVCDSRGPAHPRFPSVI